MLRTCARQSSRREFIAAGAAAALGLRSGLSLAAPAAVTGSVFLTDAARAAVVRVIPASRG